MPRSSSDPAQVAALRDGIAEDVPAADAVARAWTQLGADLPPTVCHVVGRVGWVRANLDGLQGVLDPLAEKLSGSRLVASRILGAQVGSILGLLSGKVIGQYVLPLAGDGPGRLIVVGPNLLDLAAEHGVLAGDIRRTVLVHEITHRLQFDGVPWLGDHLRSLLSTYLSETRLDFAAILERADKLPATLAEIRETKSILPMMDIVLSETQREVMEQAQDLMTVIEGHGNASMFAAQDIVDDIDGVRDAFESRKPDAAARLLTAIAGLEMKKKQYRDGEAWVTDVVERGGVETLNRAFAEPSALPRGEEIHDVALWLARVAPDAPTF